MLITRQSPFSGKWCNKELNTTAAEIDNWQRGMVAQKAFPNLSEDDREFIMTGITAEEWDNMFSGGEE